MLRRSMFAAIGSLFFSPRPEPRTTPVRIRRLQSGDCITADEFNQLVDAINGDPVIPVPAELLRKKAELRRVCERALASR